MPGFAVSPDFRSVMKHNPLANSRAEYYYNYTWYVPTILGGGRFADDARILVHLKEATCPTFSVNVEKYLGASVEYKYAKSVTWDDVRLSWYDTVGLLDIVRQWRRSVWSPQDGLRPAAEYQRLTELVSYLPDGSQSQMWQMHDSWPSSIKYGDLTYSSSDIKAVEVTLSYNYAEEFTPAETAKILR